MQYDLTDAIILEAAPKALVTNNGWVTLSWHGVSNPTETDFVAAYAGSPASTLKVEEIAPIKYQYASVDPGYLQNGSGQMKFRLLEYVGGEYIFGFFRGNVSFPVRVCTLFGCVPPRIFYAFRYDEHFTSACPTTYYPIKRHWPQNPMLCPWERVQQQMAALVVFQQCLYTPTWP